MLARERRISHVLFEEVMKHGKSFQSPHFSLRVLFKENLTTSHFSVIVPKKVSVKATVRNTNRRKVYPLIKEFQSRLEFPAASLIFVKRNISLISIPELTEELRQLLKKAFNI